MRIIILLLFALSLNAQNNDQRLAYQYYIDGDYEKAILLYEEINKKSFSLNTYNPYYVSLINLNRFSEAEKIAKKQFSKNGTRLNFLADVIVAQYKLEQKSKYSFNLKKLLNQINGRKSQVIQIANRFQYFEMYSLALEIYEASTEKNKSQYDLQKAQLYGLLGKDNLMIEKNIDYLLNNPNQKKIVFANIQRFVDNNGIKNKTNNQIVKKSLLSVIRLYPERYDFNELLVWLFIQNKQYKMAVSHVISIDRKTNNSIDKVYTISETLLDLEKYELAIEALDYIISKGFNSELYINAHINKLFALTKTLDKKEIDLEKINNSYLEVLNEVGKNSFSVLLMANYAHFKAFYLDELNEARVILEQAMNISGIDKQDLAECKIQYADILLLSEKIWDALLYYSQVENDFKESPIGHKAKFKRAKIAYYQGDFNWAQAQLDVLKSSTSKLISNDAMDLSLLITDNYNLDTIDAPMMMYAKADLFSFQKKYTQAILLYDSILSTYKGHDLSDEIYFRKYEIYIQKDSMALALNMLESIINDYSYEILIDDALYNTAKIYEYNFNDKEKASFYYQKIISDHQGSIYASQARERFRILRGDKLNNDL